MNDNSFVHSNEFDSNVGSPLTIPQSLPATLVTNLPPSVYYIPSFISPVEEAALLQHINCAPLPAWKTLSHRRLQAYPSVLSKSNTLLDASLPAWLTEPIITRLLAIPLHLSGSEDTDYALREGENGIEQPHANQGNSIFGNSPHGAPNHCLVNEYLPGQGIHPHEDGNAYWPVVCTVSLGSHTVLEVSRKSHDRHGAYGNSILPAQREGVGLARKWKILQERRSLLVSTGEVYTDCLHGIEGVAVDEGLGPDSIVNWDMLEDKGGFEEGRRERGKRVSLTFRDVLKVKALGRAFGGLKR